jgi:hypothetical protein
MSIPWWLNYLSAVEWEGGQLIGEKVYTATLSLSMFLLYIYKSKHESFIFYVHITGSIRVAICCSLGSSEDY